MSNIANIGYDLGFNIGAIRRVIFTLTKNDGGTNNVISKTNAAAIANLKTLFNTYNHAADPSIKAVPTPLVYAAGFEDGEPTYWEIEDFRQKMLNAPSDFLATIPACSPYILKNLALFENEILSCWFVTINNYLVGIDDGTDVKPFPIQTGSLSVPYYKQQSYDKGSENVFKFRLSSGSDRNNTVAVLIADGDVTDSSDFFSLRDVTGTITSPATTGCTISTALDDKNPTSPATVDRMLGCPYTGIKFVDNASGTVISLAGAGSVVETSGVYAVSEVSLLTSGHSYTCKMSLSGYDVVCGVVTVP